MTTLEKMSEEARKNRKISKTFKVSLKMYEKLEEISTKRYPELSVNRIVIGAFERILETKRVIPYFTEKKEKEVYCARTYGITEELFNNLTELGKSCNTSLTRLVNIAVHNILFEAGLNPFLDSTQVRREDQEDPPALRQINP